MMRRPQQGLSLLEFTLVAMIFSVLVAVALDRITVVRVDVERAAVKHAVGSMQSALAARFAQLIVRGDRERIAEWEGGNALRLLRDPMDGSDGADGVSGPGDWSYENGEIVYRPAYPRALTGTADGVGRWRVELLGSREDPKGLALRTIKPLFEPAAN